MLPPSAMLRPEEARAAEFATSQCGSLAAMAMTLDVDRLDNRSRTALLYARIAVSEYGGAVIDSPHVVIGALRAAPDAVRACGAEPRLQGLMSGLSKLLSDAERLGPDAEVPMSKSAARLLEDAIARASTRGAAKAEPVDILIACLNQPSAAAELLADAGIDADKLAIREK